jgi:alkylation response protein AidB-like acyl-CoA dehydrogenase
MEFAVREYEGFQKEVEDWCKDRWPGGFGPSLRGGPGRMSEWESVTRDTQQALGEKGWLCGGWPVEYGGGGWPKVKQAVFNYTASYRRIPGTGNANLGTSTIGPTIMIYGTEEQKKTYIPRIATGSIRWSQGFSEPNAGSDLASLQTRAVADGDDFVINGAKIWNHSTHADVMLLLARTDPEAPKHRGITQFIMPLKDAGGKRTEGITIQPILNAYHQEGWTLLTMEDVRLPRSAVIGEVNRGWYQTTTSLDFERSQMAWVAQSQRMLENVINYAKIARKNGKALIQDTFVRDQLAALAVEVEMARWLSYRIAYLQDQNIVPNSEASMSKLWATETQQRIQRVGATIVGSLGHLSAGSEWAEWGGMFDEDYWMSIGTTLAGGASEIQRNIIATRGLGLPR